MQLIWRRYQDEIFGLAYRLEGLPLADDSGSAHRRNDKQFVAKAFIGGRFLFSTAGTAAAAMARLSNSIDRQSIGLLGTDYVHFKVEN
jgi:hypothetical protein